MNDEVIADLKQFIATTVSQQVTGIRDELKEDIADLRTEVGEVRTELKQEIGELRTEMREGFAGVGDAIAAIHDDLADHDRRISKLEKSAHRHVR